MHPPVSPEDVSHQNWTRPPPAVSPEPNQREHAAYTHRLQSADVPQASSNQSLQTGASALGFGGPSDWERYDASSPAIPSPIERQHEAVGASLYTQSTPPVIEKRENSHNVTDNSFRPDSRQNQQRNDHIQTQDLKHTSTPDTKKSKLSSTSPLNIIPSAESGSSSDGLSQGINRTGTIDGVIQAWSQPIHGATAKLDRINTPSSSRKSSVSTNRDPMTPPAQLVKMAQPYTPKSGQSDVYNDLEPESRAALTRYVAMLKREAAEESEVEKFDIFRTFMDKELRLRSVLYGVEVDESSSNFVRTQRQKEPVAAPLMYQENIPSNTATVAAPKQATPSSEPMPQAPVSSEVKPPAFDVRPQPPTCVNTQPPIIVAPPTIEADDEYSPGGRPKMQRPIVTAHAAIPVAKSSTAPRGGHLGHVNNIVRVQSNPGASYSPSNDAPMVVTDYSLGGSDSPNYEAPIAIDSEPKPIISASRSAPIEKPPKSPMKFEPVRPAYTPFRYNEGPQRGSERLSMNRPANEAFSSLRSQDGGRVMSQAPPELERAMSPTTARREHAEAFIGLMRQKSLAYRDGKPLLAPGKPAALRMPAGPPPNPRDEAITALQAILPKTMPDDHKSAGLTSVEAEAAKIKDEFGFIHQIVVDWDKQNRQIRTKQDDERQKRQEESERQIDELFNDHEIGYSDIGAMEADFKLAEATKKYEEDQQELDSFTTTVYEKVTTRLRDESSRLSTQYIRALDILDLESVSAGKSLTEPSDRPRLAQTMNVVYKIFLKIQIREQKIAEAQFEHERRRKRLEISVLHANSDSAGMKKLEQEYALAQRMQIMHEAQDKDKRANRLMDAFDRATVRGLGDNQTYVDDLLAKVKQVEAVLLRENEEVPNVFFAPGGVRQMLSSAEGVFNFPRKGHATAIDDVEYCRQAAQ